MSGGRWNQIPGQVIPGLACRGLTPGSLPGRGRVGRRCSLRRGSLRFDRLRGWRLGGCGGWFCRWRFSLFCLTADDGCFSAADQRFHQEAFQILPGIGQEAALGLADRAAVRGSEGVGIPAVREGGGEDETVSG